MGWGGTFAHEEIVVDVGQIDNALFDGIDDSRELRHAYNRFLDDIEALWKTTWEESGVMTKEGHHFYQTGDYIAHIKTLKIPYRKWAKKFLRDGVPMGVVYNDSDVAHFIEYGTEADYPESRSPWGPNTPTPEFAPMRKTAILADRIYIRE